MNSSMPKKATKISVASIANINTVIAYEMTSRGRSGTTAPSSQFTSDSAMTAATYNELADKTGQVSLNVGELTMVEALNNLQEGSLALYNTMVPVDTRN